MMFQQSRHIHGLEQMDFLSHQKMAERMLSPQHHQTQQPQQQQNQQSTLDAQSAAIKRQRMDVGGGNQTVGSGSASNQSQQQQQQEASPYLHLQPNFFPLDPTNSTIVVSKVEYETIRQEVVNLKQALTEFRSNVETEINQLKKENKNLKEQVAKCTCGCNGTTTMKRNLPSQTHRARNNSEKLDDDVISLQNSFDKSLDDDVGRSPSQNLMEFLNRENKNLQQQNQELEKQISQIRAAANRVPPIPSTQAMSFFRELIAYYTILESNSPDNHPLNNTHNHHHLHHNIINSSNSINSNNNNHNNNNNNSSTNLLINAPTNSNNDNVNINSTSNGTNKLVTYAAPSASTTGGLLGLGENNNSIHNQMHQHQQQDCKPLLSSSLIGGYGSVGGLNSSYDGGHNIFGPSIPSNTCSIYGSMPEAFDVEKGLQVQLLPSYNVWVSKCKLQLLLKEATSLKDGGQLYVLRRLIPLVFTWEELAASRGQGLNCKSTDDVLSKDPLDPTKVLVCKAYMRKFCLETGQSEPTEKSINETFSHQVNYARRKFKRNKMVDGVAIIGDQQLHQSQQQDVNSEMEEEQHQQNNNSNHHHQQHHLHNTSYVQQQDSSQHI